MSRKTYLKRGTKAKERWQELAIDLGQACRDAEAAGHAKMWYRDELEDMLKPILVEYELNEDHIRSWFDKVQFATTGRDTSSLDMDPTPDKGPKYFWRHDGQMPAGPLMCRAQIVRGMVVPVFDLAWTLARTYDADELVQKLGESALVAIIMARIGAYQQIDDYEQKKAVLAVLSELEREVADRVHGLSAQDVYGEIFGGLLPERAAA